MEQNNSMQNMVAVLVGVERLNETARFANQGAMNAESPVHPIRNENGAIPDDFPATRGRLMSMTGRELVSSLNFYGLETGGRVSAQRNRLMVFLGVPRQ